MSCQQEHEDNGNGFANPYHSHEGYHEATDKSGYDENCDHHEVESVEGPSCPDQGGGYGFQEDQHEASQVDDPNAKASDGDQLSPKGKARADKPGFASSSDGGYSSTENKEGDDTLFDPKAERTGRRKTKCMKKFFPEYYPRKGESNEMKDFLMHNRTGIFEPAEKAIRGEIDRQIVTEDNKMAHVGRRAAGVIGKDFAYPEGHFLRDGYKTARPKRWRLGGEGEAEEEHEGVESAESAVQSAEEEKREKRAV